MAIGKSVRRVDAVAKVTGRARYTDDFYIPGMLVARYLRSTIAHGRVEKIDTRKASLTRWMRRTRMWRTAGCSPGMSATGAMRLPSW